MSVFSTYSTHMILGTPSSPVQFPQPHGFWVPALLGVGLFGIRKRSAVKELSHYLFYAVLDVTIIGFNQSFRCSL
jgi:hypothetical protein